MRGEWRHEGPHHLTPQAQNQQSLSKYHEHFNTEVLGTKTSVADDINEAQLKKIQDMQSKTKYQVNVSFAYDRPETVFWKYTQGYPTSFFLPLPSQLLSPASGHLIRLFWTTFSQADFKNDIIGSKVSIADDKTSQFMKEIQDQTSLNKYHEDFKKNIVGTVGLLFY